MLLWASENARAESGGSWATAAREERTRSKTGTMRTILGMADLRDRDLRSGFELVPWDFTEEGATASKEEAWKAHCRDAPWGVSGAEKWPALPQSSGGTSGIARLIAPPQRRPTGRLYSGGKPFETSSKGSVYNDSTDP